MSECGGKVCSDDRRGGSDDAGRLEGLEKESVRTRPEHMTGIAGCLCAVRCKLERVPSSAL